MPRPTKTTTTATDTETPVTTDYPALEIRRRRIQTGELPALRPREIPLVNQPVPMQTWIFNTADDAMRLYVAKNQRGWEHVTEKEVAGGLSGDLRVKDGVVVLGHRGEEYLMKMPLSEWKAIQVAKGKRLDEKMRNPKAIKAGAVTQMEHDARDGSRATVEHLERAAERMGGIEITDLNISHETEVGS